MENVEVAAEQARIDMRLRRLVAARDTARAAGDELGEQTATDTINAALDDRNLMPVPVTG